MKLRTFIKKFSTDEACRAHLESVRWPEGPVCPRCGTVAEATAVANKPGYWLITAPEPGSWLMPDIFAAQGIEDSKSFVRMRIAADGTLSDPIQGLLDNTNGGQDGLLGDVQHVLGARLLPR